MKFFSAKSKYTVRVETSFNYANDSSQIQGLKLSFGLSNRDKPLLVYNYHSFRCNKTTVYKKYWLYNESQCGVYTRTSTAKEFSCINDEHNHCSNPD